MKEKDKKDMVMRNFLISEIRSYNPDEHLIESVISTDIIDRYNEIVIPEGIKFKNYMKNPVVLWAHRTDIPCVGKCVSLRLEGNKIIAKTKFADTALGRELEYLYTNPKEDKIKFLNAFSIGFLPLKWEDGNGSEGNPDKTYHEWEILEYSPCDIPANPEAVQNMIERGWKITKEIADLLNVKLPEEVHKPEPEISENYIRIRVEDPDLFADDSFRTIDISADKGIKAIIGKYKDDPDGPTHTQSFLFDKEKWTVDEAQTWVNEHKDYALESYEFGTDGFIFIKIEKIVNVEPLKEDIITLAEDTVTMGIDNSSTVNVDFKNSNPQQVQPAEEAQVKELVDNISKQVESCIKEEVHKAVRYAMGKID